MKRVRLIFFLYIFSCSTSIGQSPDSSASDQWVLKIPYVYTSMDDLRERFVQSIVDSLNNYDSARVIPAFIF